MIHEIQVLDKDGLGIPQAKVMTLEEKLLALTDDNGYIRAELPGVVKVGTFYTTTETVVLGPGVNVVKLGEKIFELPEAEVIAEREPKFNLLMWLYIFLFIFIFYNLSK